MHHQIRPNGSAYDLTPPQLRAELDPALARRLLPGDGRRLVAGQDGRAEGQDAGRAHVRRRDQQPGRLPARTARLDPNTAARDARGVRRRRIPTSRRSATFYIPRNVFEGNGSTAGGDAALARRARVRARQPHEGPHPAQHARPDRRAASARARQPRDLRPAPRLPARDDGAAARRAPPPELARGQRHAGTASRTASPASSSPAPSRRLRRSRPSGTRRRSRASARTRPGTARATSPPGCGSTCSSGTPGLRYVSDGDPERITFPRAKASELAPEYRSRAKPY